MGVRDVTRRVRPPIKVQAGGRLFQLSSNVACDLKGSREQQRATFISEQVCEDLNERPSVKRKELPSFGVRKW